MPTLRSIGIRAVRVAPFLLSSARWLYARLPDAWHDTPTSWLQRQFRGQRQLTFIQLGAFDGIAGDPLRPLLLENPGWSGVLVEPQLRAFSRLRANYLGIVNRLHFLNCAASDSTGDMVFYEIPDHEIERLRLPDWSREIASACEGHIERHFAGLRAAKRCVTAMKFADIAKLYSLARVDLIVMDVEGHERRIIEDIDFGEFCVRALVYEHKHIDPVEHAAIAERLKSFGFRLRNYGRDTVAYR